MVTRECMFCGAILEKEDYVCSECENKINLLKKLRKLDKAQKNIQKSVKKYLKRDIDYSDFRYSVARKIVYEQFEFNSTEEMCFALQLEKEKIRYYPNYKIGDYKVDFILPDMKIIVEIDGELYHKDENKEFIRERGIMNVVGNDYEIVRLPASYVPGYIVKDLKEIIKFVIDKRKFDNRFRDTRWDSQYFEQYFQLKSHLRRGGNRGY